MPDVVEQLTRIVLDHTTQQEHWARGFAIVFYAIAMVNITIELKITAIKFHYFPCRAFV